MNQYRITSVDVTIDPDVKTTFKMVKRWPTESIVITLSGQTIKDRRGGLRQILQEWRAADGENSVWWYRTGTVPKDLVLFVYWVIAGRVRWKSKMFMIEEDKTMQFSNQSKPMYGKVWFGLFDFEPIPRKEQVNMKGFQGFRYFYPDQQ